MSGDEFELLLRRAVPSVEITDDRLDALISGTLARAQSIPQRGERWPWLGSPRWLAVMQYAVPMVVAVVMGITVSSRYSDDLPVAQFSSLMWSSSLIASES
jgi:hypothetical protein